MKIIIDNGGTKLDWSRVGDNNFNSTIGINVFDNETNIVKNIKSTLTDNLSNEISIDFYTAGYSEVIKKKFKNIFETFFPKVEINIYSDMLGASRALFNKSFGISCILGTGSNCAFFDGVSNHMITHSLGYLFSDEGSGYHLGKKIILKYFHNNLSNELNSLFEHNIKLSKEKLIESIYSSRNPKSYIASFSYFLKENERNPEIKEIIQESILEFLENHPFKKENYQNYPFGFVGGVAFAFQDHILQIMNKNGIDCKIIKKPIESLGNFYVQ